jgi:hypothetical protein
VFPATTAMPVRKQTLANQAPASAATLCFARLRTRVTLPARAIPRQGHVPIRQQATALHAAMATPVRKPILARQASARVVTRSLARLRTNATLLELATQRTGRVRTPTSPTERRAVMAFCVLQATVAKTAFAQEVQ